MAHSGNEGERERKGGIGKERKRGEKKTRQKERQREEREIRPSIFTFSVQFCFSKS